MVKADLNPVSLVPEPVLFLLLCFTMYVKRESIKVSHLRPRPPMCVQEAVPESRKGTLSGGAGNHPWQTLDADEQVDPRRSDQGMQEAEDFRSLASWTGSPHQCPALLGQSWPSSAETGPVTRRPGQSGRHAVFKKKCKWEARSWLHIQGSLWPNCRVAKIISQLSEDNILLSSLSISLLENTDPAMSKRP